MHINYKIPVLLQGVILSLYFLENLVSKLQKKRKLVLNPVRRNNKIKKTKHINISRVSKTKNASKSFVNSVHKNIKHNTKAIESSASSKVNKVVKQKLNSARKYDKINKAKVTKTGAIVKGAKLVKGTQSPKITQKNQRPSKNGTLVSKVAGKIVSKRDTAQILE